MNAAHLECAARGRPRFDIGDIVRAHRDELEATRTLNIQQSRALSAIAACRTAQLGGHLDVCTACGHEQPSYNSCRNRHCPKCQALAQERWIAGRLERLLPVPHFHVVFTLPSEFRPLAAFAPKRLYDLLFEVVSRTLLDVMGSRLGALPGITGVLHTWTRELRLHPHLHCIVTGGGLALDGGRWVGTSRRYLLPVRLLGRVFRGKFLEALRREHARGHFSRFDAFVDPKGFGRFCARAARHRWVVYAKKPFAAPEHVVRYLGRYTHRVAISNSRLVDLNEHHVTFRTKLGKTTSVAPVDFLARFVQHVLPRGFVKIRHYGLFAASNVHTRLERARALLPSPVPSTHRLATTYVEILLALTGRDLGHCALCHGPVERRALSEPTATNARAPP